MSKTNITYIVSNIDKAISFEWINEKINKDNYQISFILLNPKKNSSLSNYLYKNNIKHLNIKYKGKIDLPKAFIKILITLVTNRPHVIHCHLFEASLIGLLAGKILLIKKRIYTRHHSTFFHIYYPKSVKYDLLINYLATHIIAISNNVKNVLIKKENVKPSKITLIHHGFDLSKFDYIDHDKIELLKNKYNLAKKSLVIGVIARYTQWKGIQYIIPAFKELLQTQPHAHIILANAKGEYKSEIQKLLSTLPINSFTEIEFEPDLFSLYHLFNIYIHTPIDDHSEAFGQTYVEALAAGIPSIFTLSGISTDFIKNNENAIIVDYCNSKSILEALNRLINDNKLKMKIIAKGKTDVSKTFKLMTMIESFEKLYSS